MVLTKFIDGAREVDLDAVCNNGNLITRHESLPSKEVLKELGDDYYAYLISAIVNHCNADSHHFDDALRNLLRSI